MCTQYESKYTQTSEMRQKKAISRLVFPSNAFPGINWLFVISIFNHSFNHSFIHGFYHIFQLVSLLLICFGFSPSLFLSPFPFLLHPRVSFHHTLQLNWRSISSSVDDRRWAAKSVNAGIDILIFGLHSDRDPVYSSLELGDDDSGGMNSRLDVSCL